MPTAKEFFLYWRTWFLDTKFRSGVSWDTTVTLSAVDGRPECVEYFREGTFGHRGVRWVRASPPLSYLYIRGRGDLLPKFLCCRFMDRFFQTRNIFDWGRKKFPKENVNFLAFHAYKLACFRNERGLNFDRQDESRFVIKEILKDISRPSTSFYLSLLMGVYSCSEEWRIVIFLCIVDLLVFEN